ncbi:MAG: Gfo/Idh/MocA family oxidoreductase [Dehalococcoidia bacterium]
MGDGVRLGVIGAGPMGRHHCRTLAGLPGVQLVTVADLNVETARLAAVGAPGAVATDDHVSLLADASTAAVIITTPNDTHAALIAEAARAGKHIFCEKPLSRDLASADEALAAVASSGVKLQLGFQRRFDPAYRRAKAMLSGGELGALELVMSTTRDPAPPAVDYMRHSGGLFTDTLIHDIDSVRYLTGQEIVAVSTAAAALFLPPEGREEGFVDTAVTTLRLDSGALAVVTNSLRATYGYEVGAEVLGERGKVSVGQEELTRLRRFDDSGVRSDHVVSVLDRFGEAFAEELASFVRCLREGTEPSPSGADGRAALAAALAAKRSHEEGRWVEVAELG